MSTRNPQSPRPQDDLFGAINGHWLHDHQIPADRPSDGEFYRLRDQSETDVKTIIEDLSHHNDLSEEAQKIADLYKSFLDTETIEQRGLTPIESLLTSIDNVASIDDFFQLAGELHNQGVQGLVGLYIDTNPKDPNHYALNITQSGLGLPDESYYREEHYEKIRQAYLEHITNIFALAHISYGADEVVALETSIAHHHWNIVDRRDAEKSYNPKKFVELVELSSTYPWEAWFSGQLLPKENYAQVIVAQPSYVSALDELIQQTPLTRWKLWLKWKVLHTFAPYLTQAFVQENYNFYSKTLAGTEEIRPRWKRAVSLVESLIGFAVGKIYVQKHFPPQAKEEITALVNNLIEAYRQSITELPWMTPATKDKALKKLAQFTPKVGYPEQWIDYSQLSIDPQDLIGNVIRGRTFETLRELSRLSGPVDKKEWFMTPQTVNAYYNPGMNEIVFPAAILQPPFFDPQADPALNYGGIGAVIGHEIGHGFDDQGSKYDGTGALNNWWTDQDRLEFTKRTSKLIEQYNAYTPRDLDPSIYHVNGALTIGENIGDLGGLTIALLAYEISLQGQPSPILNGHNGIHRIYENWARIWRAKSRKEFAIQLLAIDPHSPAEFRCNGIIRNIDSFYETYSVQPSDKLYLKPEERVRIW